MSQLPVESLPMPQRLRVAAGVLGVSLLLTGCIPEENLDAAPDGGVVADHVEPVEFPDTKVAERAAWIINELNDNRALNRRDWHDKVSDDFKATMPVDSMVGTLNAEIRPHKPFVASEYREVENGVAQVRLTPPISSEPFDMTVSLDQDGKIDALWFEPVEGDSLPSAD